MEQEFFQLAREVVAALQAGPEPSWVEVAQLGVSCLTLVVSSSLVLYGLRQMGKASEERNKQLDIMEAANREQSRTQGETLGKIGAALERQGEVLAALLRRPA